MLLPGLVWYFTYNYLPMYGLTIAFKDFKIIKGILDSPWATPWYKHFARLFASPTFPIVLRNTVLLSVYRLFFGTLASLFIALLLNECRVSWYKRLTQTLNFAPFFLSWVIVYGLFLALFSQQTGLVSRWVRDLGGQPTSLLQSTRWFRTVLIGTSIWKNAGYGAVIYLAALAGIDPSLYEAAAVDGANRLQLIRHITLPAIRGVLVMLLVLNLGRLLFAGFEQVFVFYNVRVYEVADIIDTWIFRMGLEQLNFSISVAMGLFQAVIGFVLVLSANRLAKHWGERTLW
jgi:putative aldouronate transport system permease protein